MTLAADKAAVTVEMERNNMKKEKIVEYDVLRVIVTLLVLLGHCTYYALMTPYGGIDYTALFLQSSVSKVYSAAVFIDGQIYMFHMPLYIALSGALFYLSLSGGGYRQYRDLLSKKAKNLLIPYFVVTLVYVVPLKYVSGYFSASTNLIKDVFVGQLLCQGNNHLWFLPTLFLIFLLVYTLERFIKNHALNFILLLALFCAETVFPEFFPITLIQLMSHYAVWFYLGYCFEIFRPKLKESMKKRTALWMICSFTGMIIVKIISMMTPDILVWPKQIVVNLWILSLCFLAYVISVWLAQTKVPQTKVMQVLRENTLGMYLYSDPLNYIILFFTTQWFGGVIFISNLASAAFILVRFLITLIVPILISVVLRRCRIKYLA